MKINVMGAGGQLGGKIVQELLKQGAPPEDLILSARTPSKIAAYSDQGADVRKADYDDPKSMVSAFRDAEILLLIPTLAPVEPRIQQHAAAIQVAQEVGVKRLVFTGFLTATPTSRFLIAPFLLYAESKVRLSGLDWTLLRDGMYLDPILDWIPELIEMGRLPYPVKSGRVAFISRDDLGRSAAAACLHSGHSKQLYELTGPKALSMPELAQVLSDVTNSEIRFDSISDAQYAEICRQGKEDVPESLIQLLISLYHAVENGELEHVTDHVERLTGSPAESTLNYLRKKVN